MAKLDSEPTENLTNQDHDDIDDDDDDDQVTSLHKITPGVYKPAALGDNNQDTLKTKLNESDFDVKKLIQNDLQKYVNTSIPKNYSDFIHCHIKRDKESITKGFTTTYSLYFDGQNENDQNLLLTARKHLTLGGHSEYFIGTDVENPSRNLSEESSIAKLRGINISGSEYILYDHQNSSNNDQNKAQLAAIVYDAHIFGSKEPRKLTVLLCDSGTTNQQSKDGETIINEWRSGRSTDLIEIKNKTPVYDEESKTYTLSLYGNRVKQPSHKNFQLITSDGDDTNNVTMQFGRIDDNHFALDYRYPLTAIQAFAIALSSFHNRFQT